MSHSCTQSRVEHVASRQKPFHFVDSGLSKVYLVGIKYYTCDCGRMFAEIPALKQLMQLIAADLLGKQTSLTGEEVRFLRKRLGKKQQDFAVEIGIEPETLNRYENDKTPISEVSDKFIRLYYLVFSGDERLADARAALEDLLKQWQVSTRPKKIVKNVKNNQWHDLTSAG